MLYFRHCGTAFCFYLYPKSTLQECSYLLMRYKFLILRIPNKADLKNRTFTRNRRIISFYACLLCKIFFLYECKLSSKLSLVSPQVCLHVWQSPFATSKKHDSRATARPSLELRTWRNLHPCDILCVQIYYLPRFVLFILT